MPEPIAQWWARRQRSRGAPVPYAVGTYLESWRSYPALIRQYHPEFNDGIVLSQIPPAADVYLCWQCDVGHLFVATPAEQRQRPGRERRRSSWCPDCSEAAAPRTPAMPMREGPLAATSASPLERWLRPAPPVGADRPVLPARLLPAGAASAGVASAGVGSEDAASGRAAGDRRGVGGRQASGSPRAPGGSRRRGGATGEPSVALPTAAARSGVDPRPAALQPPAAAQTPTERERPSRAAGTARTPARRRGGARGAGTVCAKTPLLPAGEAFASDCAPAPASAVEGELRAALTETLEFTAGVNAIRLARPFFDHLEAWPDVILPELRVAIEYDSTGRFGLEHVGRREEADRRKDRALRGVGWEVIRIRTGHLPALGPHDLRVGSLSKRTLSALVDELRVIRGALIVDCYLKPGS